MADDVYFDGDPAHDSRRRHLERVIKGEQRRRWPWIVAIAAGGAWALWRTLHRRDSDGQQQRAAGSDERRR